MVELHYPTLSLVVALVNVVGVVVMAALWRINPGLPGPGLWTLAAVLSNIGFLAAALRPLFGSLTSLLDNSWLYAAALLHLEGVLRFKGLPPARGRWWAGAALVALVGLLAVVNRDDPVQRYRWLDPLVVGLLVATAAALMWRSPARGRAVYGFCALAVLVAAGVFGLRWSLAMGAPTGQPLLSHPLVAAVFLSLLLHHVTWIYTMSLAVNLRVQADLQALALVDGLTGVANRHRLDDVAASALRRAARRGECVAVVLLDLDGFKAVNDRLGHAAGDQALREVAARAQRGSRATDLVARIGGDEFVVLLETATPESVDRAVDRLRQALLCAPLAPDPAVHLGFSLGVAVFPADGADLAALLQAADRRMYKQKREHGQTRPGGLN